MWEEIVVVCRDFWEEAGRQAPRAVGGFMAEGHRLDWLMGRHVIHCRTTEIPGQGCGGVEGGLQVSVGARSETVTAVLFLPQDANWFLLKYLLD